MKKKNFSELLQEVIREHFDGSSRLLAESTGLDPSLVSRILNSKREPTPMFVGRVASALKKQEADALIAAYLRGIADKVAEQQRAAKEETRNERASVLI